MLLQCDADPGRVNKWASKYATKIAVAFAEGAEYFPKDKVAHTGNPVRKAALLPAREGAAEFLKLRKEMPVLLVTGGSQGSGNAKPDTTRRPCDQRYLAFKRLPDLAIMRPNGDVHGPQAPGLGWRFPAILLSQSADPGGIRPMPAG